MSRQSRYYQKFAPILNCLQMFFSSGQIYSSNKQSPLVIGEMPVAFKRPHRLSYYKSIRMIKKTWSETGRVLAESSGCCVAKPLKHRRALRQSRSGGKVPSTPPSKCAQLATSRAEAVVDRPHSPPGPVIRVSVSHRQDESSD